MDEEGFGAVDFLDVRLWDTGLKAQDGVGVELEDAQNAVNFIILESMSVCRACGAQRTLCALSKARPAASSSASISNGFSAILCDTCYV